MAKASMDELTGSWLVDESGEIDEDSATYTWTVDYLGGSAVDKQSEIEATKKALDSLLAHRVVEDMKRDDAANSKFLTTRWEKGWRMKASEGPVLSWCNTFSWVIDCIALKLGLETFEADAVDAY